MKNILVIGALGQLGSAVLRQEPNSNVNIIGLDIKDCDITVPDKIKQIFLKYEPMCVINCAAYLNAFMAESNIMDCFNLNAQAVYNLVVECNNFDTELIQISSDFVFGGGKNTPFTEDDQTNPINVYGLSKVASEQIASKSKKHKIVRISGLFGLTPCIAKKTFIIKVLEDLRDGKEVKIYNHHRVTMTYAEDVAQRLLWLTNPPLDFLPSKNNIYHLANEGPTSWYVFANVAATYRPGLSQHLFIRPEHEEAYENSILKRPNYSALTNTTTAPLPHWTDALRRFIEKQTIV